MERKLFGEILVEEGLVNQQDLDAALELQKEMPGFTIGKVLWYFGLIEDFDLLFIAVKQSGIDNAVPDEISVPTNWLDVTMNPVEQPEWPFITTIELPISIFRKDAVAGKISLRSLANDAKRMLAQEIVEFCESALSLPLICNDAEIAAMKVLEDECRKYLQDEVDKQALKESGHGPFIDPEDEADLKAIEETRGKLYTPLETIGKELGLEKDEPPTEIKEE